MKTSTFLTKVLKSFNNGKSYSSFGFWRSPTSGYVYCKNRNLTQALTHLENKIGIKMANKAKVAISRSLGHTNIEGFEAHGFSKVKAVVKAAIKRERAAGN